MTKNEILKFCIERIKLDTGLKQAEIAQKIDVKSTYLSDMINGRVPLTESVCQKISEVFHTDILNDTGKQPQQYAGESERPNNEIRSNERNHQDTMDKMLELLAMKEASLAKAQEHIDKLLEIIANQTK